MKKHTLLAFVILMILAGCGNDTTSQNDLVEQNNAYRFVQTSNQTNQSLANKVKNHLNKQMDFNMLYAVNTDSLILVAVEPRYRDRLQLESLREDLNKEVKTQVSSIEIEISTDKKIILELEKLEEKLTSEKISSKDLEKELNRIITLSKEQT